MVEPHRGLTASPKDSLDGDFLPQGFDSLRHMVDMDRGGDGISCCRSGEVGRICLQQNLLPRDITDDMRKLRVTMLGI